MEVTQPFFVIRYVTAFGPVAFVIVISVISFSAIVGSVSSRLSIVQTIVHVNKAYAHVTIGDGGYVCKRVSSGPSRCTLSFQ